MSVSSIPRPLWKCHVCIFGAPLDTGNLGVSALGKSIVFGLNDIEPCIAQTVLDYGNGLSKIHLRSSGTDFQVSRCGAYRTKRIYRPESLWNIRLCATLGGLWNPGARLLKSSNAVLDISGGDSFTDQYGLRRFNDVTLPKRIALEMGKPLILLPQTYGPFQAKDVANSARRIVKCASMAWARDQRSFDILVEFLGNAFDSSRHRAGVDVAFLLPTLEPPESAIEGLIDWLADKSTPIIGVNVSGLLMNQPVKSANQYGFRADYTVVVRSLLRRLLLETDARILLIPHVVTPAGHYESDIDACRAIISNMEKEHSNRLITLPTLADPCEVKWVISQCGWFCGTRMHSTIAALSSGVPTAAIAYSAKTLGVFETCDQGKHVADLRSASTQEVSDTLWRSYLDRHEARRSLKLAIPNVVQRATDQMRDIIVHFALPQN